MKVSWKLLNQIIDLHHITFEEFTNKLTLAGFEVEQIYNIKEINDTILDISITANRSDILSIIGLAREISILFDKQLYQKAIKFQYLNNSIICNNDFHSIKNNKDISDIAIDIITNIQNKESPEWLQNYLIIYDIKPCNILEDIRHYINIKWGQDIEIFDTQKMDIKIVNPSLFTIDKNNNLNNIIKKIDYNQLTDDKYPYLLQYKNENLSILGIKENRIFNPDRNTSSIIISSHICNPEYIKKISSILKIKTTKSIKLIKTNLRYDFKNAYNEAINLIINLTQASIYKSYQYNLPFTFTTIKPLIIHKDEINTILGPINYHKQKYLSEQDILNILKKLKFISTYTNNIFNIKIPIYREYDIKRNIDVIEEIGRIYGFNHFIDYLPNKFKQKNKPKLNLFIKKIRSIFRQMGLHEVMHYSLRKKQYNNQNEIDIYNPLLEDQSQLRTHLIYNLISTKQYNIKQKNLSIEAFEIGKVFKSNTLKSNNIEEYINLACIIGNPNYIQYHWSDTPQALSWFQAKGYLEEFFERINANIKWSKLNNKYNQKSKIYELFHPQRTAIIYNGQTSEKIGIFGQLNLKLAKQLDINELTYLFEIDIYKLLKTRQIINHLNYIIRPYSHYPSVTRDISFLLTKNDTTASIKEKIIKTNNELIESVELFNEYIHNSQNNNEHHISFRITYRSQNRTLNDQDINQIDKTIYELLNNEV